AVTEYALDTLVATLALLNAQQAGDLVGNGGGLINGLMADQTASHGLPLFGKRPCSPLAPILLAGQDRHLPVAVMPGAQRRRARLVLRRQAELEQAGGRSGCPVRIIQRQGRQRQLWLAS